MIIGSLYYMSKLAIQFDVWTNECINYSFEKLFEFVKF